MYNITVLAPHIDDEVIGAGGSIAKHIDLGNIVRVIFINSGQTKREIRVRESEAEGVIDFLGIKDADFLRKSPTSLGNRVLKEIVHLLRRHSADFIYAPHLNEGDIEHVAVSQLAHRIVWLANGNYYPGEKERCEIKALFLYEVHRPISEVHYLEDIAKYENKKVDAIRFYKSQLERVRYDQSAINLNRYRGISSEVSSSAEAFQIAAARNLIYYMGKGHHSSNTFPVAKGYQLLSRNPGKV